MRVIRCLAGTDLFYSDGFSTAGKAVDGSDGGLRIGKLFWRLEGPSRRSQTELTDHVLRVFSYV